MFVQEPVKGTGITTDWGISVARSINALQGFTTPGQLRREGDGYSGADALPANLRDRRPAAATPAASIPGLFEPDFAGTFSNCCVMLGAAFHSFGTLTGQPSGDGYYTAHLSKSGDNWSCQIVKSTTWNGFHPGISGDTYDIPLFKISSSAIEIDYRAIHFVPVYA